MTNTQIEALFPLKGKLTKEILRKAKKWNPEECAGALTLRAAIGDKYPKEEYLAWGTTWGEMGTYNTGIDVTTEENYDFFNADTEREVTFILKPRL